MILSRNKFRGKYCQVPWNPLKIKHNIIETNYSTFIFIKSKKKLLPTIKVLRFMSVQTHRRQDEESELTWFVMTSMKALAVSENFFLSTAAGNLEKIRTCTYSDQQLRSTPIAAAEMNIFLCCCWFVSWHTAHLFMTRFRR